MLLHRQKVACYITQGNRLLVFDHTQFPEAGTQIPAGTLEPGEEPAAAALREAREESGLQNLEIRAYLGMKEYDLTPLGRDEIHQRHYFHLECMEETPERWTSYEQDPSDGSPAPIELEFYWVQYPDQMPPLSGWLDDYLPILEQHMKTQTLADILTRNPNPNPWSEGDNIPWHDPDFSARMLQEHLTQDHDLASRRSEKIDRHVQFIHQTVLAGQPGKLLDLACGPGLYASRLAKLGHTVHGIDYSPASIAYAQETAQAENLACTYQHADIREAEYGQGYAAALLIFGEFNVFRPAHIRQILGKIYAALAPGGKLVIEPHTFEFIEKQGQAAPSWSASPAGLFSAQPHLVLEEHLWQAEPRVTSIRFFVIDIQTANVIRYAQSMQAYTDAEYRQLLEECGFRDIQFFPSLTGNPDPQQTPLIAITAAKV